MNTLNFPLNLAGPAPTVFASPYPTQQCQVSDGGIAIIVQVLDGSGDPVSLRLAARLEIVTVRPSGISLATPAHFFTNGFDGQMYFQTGVDTPFGAGLLEAGTWQVQGKFTLNGEIQHTAIGAFAVNANLGG